MENSAKEIEIKKDLIKQVKPEFNSNGNKKTSKKAEEKFKQKHDKKINKKIAKAINIILHHENKKLEEIFSEEPTLYLWCYHFGNGDEEDQIKIKKYFEENYGLGVRVIIYPGISYGFIELKSIDIAEAMIKQQNEIKIKNEDNEKESENNQNLEKIKNENFKKFLQKKQEEQSILNNNEQLDNHKKHKHVSINTLHHNISFNTGERSIFTIFSKIGADKVEQGKLCNCPNAQFQVNIPGLYYFEDYITEKEEQDLIESLDKNKWEKLSNRRVQHYGYEFIYGANMINKKNKIGEMPAFCLEKDLKKFKIKNNIESKDIQKVPIELAKEYSNYTFDHNEDLNDENKYQNFFTKFGNFDQLTVNDYAPGDGIPPHYDSHSPFEDVFNVLSLGSGIVMSFFYNNELKHLFIKPRTLIYFTGEARFVWEHSIALRKIDRVEDNIYFRKRRLSLTFRKIRQGECTCPYVACCDSQKKKLGIVTPLSDFNINIDQNNSNLKKTTDPISIPESISLLNSYSLLPTDIEKKHVYDVYEKIAPHFSHTRYKPWPKVAEFLNDIGPGSLNADIGCGNGKYLNVNDKTVYNIGTDRCFNLIKICKEKSDNNQVFVADSLKLPFRSNVFDTAISIAVVHHFSNTTLRLRAISEIIRVLQVGGKFLIYVWALEQEKKFDQQDNFVPWHLQNNYENEVQVQTLGPQIVKEEKKNSTIYHRYYHMFKKEELEELLKNFENIEILDSYYEHANWCCIVKKLK